MSRLLLTVWRKELKDAIRDRRSLMAAMSYAFFGPMIMAVAFFAVVNEATSERDLEITVKGQSYAPEFVEFLAQQGILHKESEQEQPIVVVIPSDYQERLARAQTVSIVVQADYSERNGSGDRSRVTRAINSYNQVVASTRLMMRGVSPEVVQAISVDRQDMATQESRAAMLLGTVMVFVLMSVFFSGMNVAIDTSAGERERNSLEFLLAQPIRLFDLVAGKAAAASSFAMLGGVLTLIMIPIVFIYVPLDKLGIDVSFSVSQQVLLAVILIPLALLASVLQLFVSFMAKSFKEAQTYITFVMFAPMTLVFVLEFTRFEHVALQYLPVTSQHQVLMGSISGNPVALSAMLVGVVSTLLLAVVLMFGVQYKLKSEKAVFGL
ncbi:ABC transporter permease [Aliidiomarina celeris]|uniref:ABC transporter permease n=1 Tax=Aliidiomarina celeris TaxID=2249428 RepID=UPI000DEA1540|nr:ABC transporter permease [Aliidiomarina celeris]